MQYLNDHRYKIECRRSYQPVDVRRLISDITDSSTQIHIEEDREIAIAEAYRS